MRLAKDRAIIYALAALDQARARASRGAFEPDTAIVAILAFLFANGQGDPGPYRQFRAALSDGHDTAWSNTMGNVQRSIDAHGAWLGILEDVGLVESPELMQIVSEIREGAFAAQESPICNRYRMEADAETMAERYGVYGYGGRLPVGDIFPKKPAYVIRHEYGPATATRQAIPMSWGIVRVVPGKRVAAIEKPVTNVRNLESPFWRGTLAKSSQRCLVPFTAFSEYGPVRDVDGKLPLYWFDIPSQPISSFAGIWRTDPVRGMEFAFLTCEPNVVVAPIHPKAMPVILLPEDEERWLSGSWPEVADLVAPFPSQLMSVA